ncbi:hypothetical protein [Ferruginibacter albus]|uniref:hypothetical protein n=1 Tax=Ferruginibacter albus TaxID=2875540 RepID=UPI001CC6FF36|nr:hypothetical protein [Ferruginibacter albus]UAY52444.1 hypothetical protein K9M53_01850 [Ferruginibacter albus]
MKQKHLAFICLLIYSCNQPKKENTSTSQTSTQPPTTIINNSAEATVFKLIQPNEPPQKITVSAKQKTEVIGKKKLKITVDPANLETENGTPIGDKIDIELREMTNPTDLFYNNAPTVSDGQLLVSGGAYYIGMSSNRNKLKLKIGKTLSIQVPKTTDNEMQLFYGDRDTLGNLNWIPADATFKKTKSETSNTMAVQKPIASKPIDKKDSKVMKGDLDRLLDYADSNGGRMSALRFRSLVGSKADEEVDGSDFSVKTIETIDSVSGKKVKQLETIYYSPVEIKNIGWINCDRFYSVPNKTQIKCEFDTASQISYATVYIIFKNINSMLTENIFKKDSGFSSLYTQIPVGENIKIIAVANTKGKFYSFKQDVIVENDTKVKIKLTPVNVSELNRQTFVLN